MGRTAVDTGVTMDAFALVDDRQGLSHGDRLLRAGTYALLAADAADGTVLSGPGSRPLVLAADSNRRGNRHEFKKMLRTYLDALAASVAEGTVDRDDAVFQF